MSHTPGPWYPHIADSAQGRHVQHGITAGESGLIPIASTGRWDLTSAADTYLMAAAPDLLAALKQLDQDIVDGVFTIAEAQVAIRAAIAKAEGN